ncbi:MAG: phospholipid-binding protein MlaC [Sulfurifustaceae bacterium]
MKRALIIVFTLCLSFAVRAAETPPDQLVRQVTDRIIQLIKTNRETYARDYQKLYTMVDKEVLPYFDFRVMSRAVLGRYWREANDEQRDRFVKEFRDLLVRTYATALLKYTNQEIRYLPFRSNPEDKTVLVRTEVVQAEGGENVPINYSLYRSNEGWKAYDVAVGGVSLVTNYQSVYAEKVRSQGIDALIKSLADANRRGQVDQSVVGKPGGKTQ